MSALAIGLILGFLALAGLAALLITAYWKPGWALPKSPSPSTKDDGNDDGDDDGDKDADDDSPSSDSPSPSGMKSIDKATVDLYKHVKLKNVASGKYAYDTEDGSYKVAIGDFKDGDKFKFTFRMSNAQDGGLMLLKKADGSGGSPYIAGLKTDGTGEKIHIEEMWDNRGKADDDNFFFVERKDDWTDNGKEVYQIRVRKDDKSMKSLCFEEKDGSVYGVECSNDGKTKAQLWHVENASS